MEIKYKLYPYPVLSSYSNDYGTGAFDVAIDIVRDGYDLRIDFLATLTCQSLQDCIKQGVAKFVYHLECSQTGFRTVVQTDKVSEVYTLLNKAVNGKLQICPFVVAVDDLKGFTSPDFHEDYQGIAFDIEAGCVMAVGKMVTVDISKDIDDLANTPSIFNISKNPDESCKQMLVDMSQRKIIIKLPLSDFYSYKALSATPLAQPILNSLTVVPALVYVRISCMTARRSISSIVENFIKWLIQRFRSLRFSNTSVSLSFHSTIAFWNSSISALYFRL